ncbi:MAG: hypothetical protein ABEJ28_10980 [Salinigranum sp.]
MVTLPASVVRRYPRFSLYNSPYAAHDRGHAVDLYPETNDGISPVAGEVLDTRTVRAPSNPYAAEHDHLILVDVGEYVARILHVDPAVEPGDAVEVGESLGPMVRSGFFAPWVGNHVHLEFRDRQKNPYRASGSEPLSIDAAVEPLPWDGEGRVAEVGETYVVLDSPAHPAPGERFVGVACEVGPESGEKVGSEPEGKVGSEPEGKVGSESGERAALDGGLVHYAGGGALGNATGTESRSPTQGAQPVSLLGRRVGAAAGRDGEAAGRDVAWDDVAVLANGDPIAGLSLFAARDADFGAKLICPDHGFAVGDTVRVAIRPTDDPVRFTSG